MASRKQRILRWKLDQKLFIVIENPCQQLINWKVLAALCLFFGKIIFLYLRCPFLLQLHQWQSVDLTTSFSILVPGMDGISQKFEFWKITTREDIGNSYVDSVRITYEYLDFQHGVINGWAIKLQNIPHIRLKMDLSERLSSALL